MPPRGDPARSRAAALSMVPTTTSAQKLVERVLPELEGRLLGAAVRVPTASVSAVDLCVMLERPATVDQVNLAMQQAGGVIGWTDRPLVSTDLRARPESIVMALAETQQTSGGMLRVFGWYDNEWGFSLSHVGYGRASIGAALSEFPLPDARRPYIKTPAMLPLSTTVLLYRPQ